MKSRFRRAIAERAGLFCSHRGGKKKTEPRQTRAYLGLFNSQQAQNDVSRNAAVAGLAELPERPADELGPVGTDRLDVAN